MQHKWNQLNLIITAKCEGELQNQVFYDPLKTRQTNKKFPIFLR